MAYNSSDEESCTQTDDSSKTDEESCNICGTLISLIVFGLFIGLCYYLIFGGPPPTKFSVVEASIMQFNLVNNTTLYYNFEVTITAKNFHKDIESYYYGFTVIPSYKGNQLAPMDMTPFVLGSKNTVTLQPMVFEGNSVMKFKPKQLVEYNKEKQLGIYNLHLELDLHIWPTHYVHCSNLRVPLISNGKVAPTFNVIRCSHKSDA